MGIAIAITSNGKRLLANQVLALELLETIVS